MRSMRGTTPTITLGVKRSVPGATFGAVKSFFFRMKPSTVLAVVALLATPPSVAGAQEHCSRETLTVRGTPVTIGYCITGEPSRLAGGGIALNVQSTYSAAGGSFSQQGSMSFIDGDAPSRVLQSVELGQLGLQGTLHLTLIYSKRLVRIESAMLTPGAVTIK